MEKFFCFGNRDARSWKENGSNSLEMDKVRSNLYYLNHVCSSSKSFKHTFNLSTIHQGAGTIDEALINKIKNFQLNSNEGLIHNFFKAVNLLLPRKWKVVMVKVFTPLFHLSSSRVPKAVGAWFLFVFGAITSRIVPLYSGILKRVTVNVFSVQRFTFMPFDNMRIFRFRKVLHIQHGSPTPLDDIQVKAWEFVSRFFLLIPILFCFPFLVIPAMQVTNPENQLQSGKESELRWTLRTWFLKVQKKRRNWPSPNSHAGLEVLGKLMDSHFFSDLIYRSIFAVVRIQLDSGLGVSNFVINIFKFQFFLPYRGFLDNNAFHHVDATPNWFWYCDWTQFRSLHFRDPRHYSWGWWYPWSLFG